MLLLTYVPSKTHSQLYQEALEGKRCIYCLRSDCVAYTMGESVCGQYIKVVKINLALGVAIIAVVVMLLLVNIKRGDT